MLPLRRSGIRRDDQRLSVAAATAYYADAAVRATTRRPPGESKPDLTQSACFAVFAVSAFDSYFPAVIGASEGAALRFASRACSRAM